MTVLVEVLEGLQRQVKMTLPAANIDKAFEAKVAEMVKTASVPGFRPGKVTPEVFKKRFGDGVLEEVTHKLMHDSFIQAAEEQKIKLASHPAYKPEQHEKSKDLEFTVRFEVYPEIEVINTAGMEAEKIISEVTEEDVASALENLAKQYQEWTETSEPTKKGDRVKINFKGFIDGVAFPGGDATGFMLELGSGRMIPGFEDGLLGKKVGEQCKLDLQFPEDYHNSEYAGKKATFEVEVVASEVSNLPEYNDEFAQKLGVQEGGISKLKEEIRRHLKSELKTTTKNRLKSQVFDNLLKLNTVEVPSLLIKDEIEQLKSNMMHRFQAYAGSNRGRLPQLPDQMFEAEARKRVSLGLLVQKIIESNQIEVTEEQRQAFLDDLADKYEDKQGFIEHFKNDQSQMASVDAALLEDNVVDWLLKSAKVVEKAMKYSEVVKSGE